MISRYGLESQALQRVEDFEDVGEQRSGYIFLYERITHRYGFPTHCYSPPFWEDRNTPCMILYKWYTFPYYINMLIHPGTAPSFLPNPLPPGDRDIISYPAGFHLYLDRGPVDEILAITDPRLPARAVLAEGRRISATGWRRGDRVMVAREIQLVQVYRP